MSDDRNGSVTLWIDMLRDGDNAAAQAIWERYFERLAAIAQSRLAHLAREASGEDIALSALKSVMLGMRKAAYPDLMDRQGLWPLLVTITARKAYSEQRRQLAKKRTRAAEQELDAIRHGLEAEPSPEFAVELADELDRLLRDATDPSLRRVVELKLSGCTNEEIADDLGCARRTVIRKLNLIRREWLVDAGSPESSEVGG